MDDPARDLERYDSNGTELVSAVFSSVTRKGEWLPAEEIEVRAWFGSARLDFTSALLAPGVTTLDVSAVCGSVEILVPADLEVELGASALLGSVEQRDAGGRVHRFLAEQLDRVTGGGMGRRTLAAHDEDDDEPPVLRIEGHAICGSIIVKTRS
jgi:hypothetical protein